MKIQRWENKALAGGLAVALVISNGGCNKQQQGPNASKTSNAGPAAKTLWNPVAASAMEAKFTPDEKALREQQMDQLKAFAAAKEKQAEKLASTAGEKVSKEARRFFDAAKRGDAEKVRSMYGDFMGRHRQYEGSSDDQSLDTSYWAALLEVNLGYECAIPIDPKSLQFVVEGTFQVIPPGSIYFGGTDSGRGVVTTFSKSHADGDPFFTITQNALADNTYLVYLRRMYGNKISIPTEDDSAKCFSDYYQDAEKRLTHDQEHPNEPRLVKPGEDLQKKADGKLQISGYVSVMAINGLLVKKIFDDNPKKEFYVEESYPLDWMYPHLEPCGPIMKLDREEIKELSAETVVKDREYWKTEVKDTLGDWLTDETPLASVVEFTEKVYVHRDLSGFSGNQRYLDSEFSQKMVSKLRSSIGGMYDWRAQQARSSVERDRMTKEADLAFRQAFALCPYSPEAVFRYVNLLAREGRMEEAILLVSMAQKAGATDDNSSMSSLLEQLKQIQQQTHQNK